VNRRFLFVVVLGLALGLAGAPAWGDDFYVIAGGGTSGKVLKTQVFTSHSSSPDVNLGTSSWAKLDDPQWTYTKLSPTSYLVITYHDTMYGAGGWSYYQLRVNDLPGVAGGESAYLAVCNNWNVSGANGVWSGLPQGDLNLSIWHRQYGCTYCARSNGGFTTSVTVMEIEH
jgi:hypothetical protein